MSGYYKEDGSYYLRVRPAELSRNSEIRSMMHGAEYILTRNHETRQDLDDVRVPCRNVKEAFDEHQ